VRRRGRGFDESNDGRPSTHNPRARSGQCQYRPLEPLLFYNVEVMSGRDYLGEFEHIVLLALLRLDKQAYGVTVRREIQSRVKREVSIGAVYATLDRLEAKGYVNSYYGDPTPERGGRSKRFFRVTAEGMAAVSRTHRAIEKMTEGLALARSCS
jgi:PadR family transcriptional regulator, regulatory protein PadR